MTLKEMLKEKEHYKKRVKELKEKLNKYPPFLYFSTDDPMYDYLVGKHNALYDYEQSLETIEELEKDYIPKDKIREKLEKIEKEKKQYYDAGQPLIYMLLKNQLKSLIEEKQ